MSATTNSNPETRNLSKLVEALDIVGTELSYQVMRLNEHVKPRTPTEQEYHDNLKKGYDNAAYFVRLLKRYQEGRLERLNNQSVGGGTDGGDAISNEGVARPYLSDEDSPA